MVAWLASDEACMSPVRSPGPSATEHPPTTSPGPRNDDRAQEGAGALGPGRHRRRSERPDLPLPGPGPPDRRVVARTPRTRAAEAQVRSTNRQRPMAARGSAPLRRWQVRMPLRRPWSGLTYRDVTIGRWRWLDSVSRRRFRASPATRAVAARRRGGGPDRGMAAPRCAVRCLSMPSSRRCPHRRRAHVALEATRQGFVCVKVKVVCR